MHNAYSTSYFLSYLILTTNLWDNYYSYFMDKWTKDKKQLIPPKI